MSFQRVDIEHDWNSTCVGDMISEEFIYSETEIQKNTTQISENIRLNIDIYTSYGCIVPSLQQVANCCSNGDERRSSHSPSIYWAPWSGKLLPIAGCTVEFPLLIYASIFCKHVRGGMFSPPNSYVPSITKTETTRSHTQSSDHQ